MIFDEVVTGFRLAYGGAQEYYGVTPDLCSVGKIMGGGYPLAAVMGRSDILSVFDQDAAEPDSYVNQIGTLNGNPIACAAGLATLAELRKEGAVPAAEGHREPVAPSLDRDLRQQRDCGPELRRGRRLRRLLHRPAGDQLPGGTGGNTQMMGRFNAGLLERGILKATQKFYPSMVHSEEDVEKTITAFEEVVPSLRR